MGGIRCLRQSCSLPTVLCLQSLPSLQPQLQCYGTGGCMWREETAWAQACPMEKRDAAPGHALFFSEEQNKICPKVKDPHLWVPSSVSHSLSRLITAWICNVVKVNGGCVMYPQCLLKLQKTSKNCKSNPLLLYLLLLKDDRKEPF